TSGIGSLAPGRAMAHGTGVSFQTDNKPGADLAETGDVTNTRTDPTSARKKHAWVKEYVEYGKDISTEEELILCDSITSGGLLISLPEEEANEYVNYLSEQYSIEAQEIGKVSEQKEKSIYVK